MLRYPLCLTLLGCLLLFAGCRDKTSLTADELARVLRLHVVALELPWRSKQAKERYWWVKQGTEGHTDWFSAFDAPGPGGTVKAVINWDTGMVTFLVEDDAGISTAPTPLEDYGMHLTVLPNGSVRPQDLLICFSDSPYGRDLAQGAIFEDERQNAQWVSYRLIASSDVPEDAPAYVHFAIEKIRETQRKQAD